jgi:acetyl esterase/lipase
MLTAAEARVHRLVCGFGLYELGHLEGRLASVVPRLLFRTRDTAVWRARSPRHAPPPRVPTLLLHGDADGLVPVAQARALAAHRDSLGLPTELVVYPGAPHAFFQRDTPVAHEAARAIVRYLTEASGATTTNDAPHQREVVRAELTRDRQHRE